MRVAILVLGLALLGCTADASMSKEEAQATLQRFANDDPRVGHVCAREDRARMQRAAATYSAALAEEGEVWPSRARLEAQTDPSIHHVESYVVVMMMYGFLTPDALQGDAPTIAAQMETGIPGWDAEAADLTQSRHCRALYGVMRESMAAMIEARALEREFLTAGDGGSDYARALRYLSQRNRIAERMRKRQEDVRRRTGETPPLP
jgi:hypothetical protein